VGGMGVTMETVQKEEEQEEASGAVVAVAAVAMIVAVMTAAADTTVVDMIAVAEVDLLVWGKLHSASAPKVPPTYLNMSTNLSHNTLSLN